jgi:hypothetical protein
MTADPALGDYLSSTRGMGGIYAPQNASLYAYGWNNPATLRDPNGRFVCGGFCIAGLIILGSAAVSAIWDAGSQRYVKGSWEKVDPVQSAEAGGIGAGIGALAVVYPPAAVGVAGALTVKGGIGVVSNAPSYFRGELSPEGERQFEVNAVGTGLMAIGTGYLAKGSFGVGSATQPVLPPRGGADPVLAGQEGEATATLITGLPRNTQSFVINGRTRIPDQVGAQSLSNRNPTIINEVKNYVRGKLSLTRQLRDDVDLVGPGGTVGVMLPPAARVTRPLQRAFDDPTNPLTRIDLVRPPE